MHDMCALVQDMYALIIHLYRICMYDIYALGTLVGVKPTMISVDLKDKRVQTTKWRLQCI